MAGSSSPPVETSRRAGLILGLLCAAGCGDELRVDVRYEVVGLPPVTDGTCGTVPRQPPAVPDATRVRFTFRDHGATGPGALRCDIAFARDASAPVIAVPRRGEPVDVWVEYFAADGKLLARGAQAGVDLTGGTVTLHAAPPDAYTCAPAQAALPRAFHSATRLPGGEVLLLGGLIGAPGSGGTEVAPSDGAYVTSSAEIYDPVAGRVFPVTIPGLAPRAFHEVVVIGEVEGALQLVVSGGIGVTGDASAAGNVAAIGGAIGEAPWRTVAPDAQLMRAGSFAPPPELLIYSAQNRGFTRQVLPALPARYFGSGAVDDRELGQPPIVGGGEGGDTAALLTAGGAVSGMPMTGVPRPGSTIVRTGVATALWIGGDLGATRVYDELRQLDSMPVLAMGPPPPAGFNRAFGAATRVGPDVLYAGGLTIGGGAITDDTGGPAAVWIAPASGTITLADAPALASAAYLAVTQIPGGQALVMGGARAGQVECRGTLACPSAQSVRLGPGVASATGAPGLARYGHRLTTLLDGTVLVSGGFTAGSDPARVRAVATLERFEPHQDDPLADLSIVRAPGEVALLDGVPIAPCTLVQGGETADAAAPPIDAPEPDALEIDAAPP